MLPVFADVLGDDALARARKATRRVTRALGPVRELDVAAALFHEFALAHEAGPAAVVSVTRDLARARSSALRRARLKLTPSRLAKLRASLEALDVALPPGAALVVSRALDARIARRAQGLQRALHRAGTLYVPARLHAVRIAVKQLRYATEVAGALHRARVSSRLAQLRALQDLLGRAHDVHVLGERLRQVQTRVVRTSRSHRT